MTDFLITTMTLYPWFTWLLVFFSAMGLGYAAVWAHKAQLAVWSWLGYRTLVWRSKAAVRRRLLEADCPVCMLAEEGLDEAMAGDDPPEYQPDEDDWDGPGEDWSPGDDWGENPARAMGSLAEVLIRAREIGMLNDDDQLPDGPPAEREGPPLCEDIKCKFYGWVHPPPCQEADTELLPRFTEPGRPAMPPVPWSGLEASLEVLRRGDDSPMLSGRVAAELGHTTTEAAVDSMFTRAQAREVQAMITDGVIPTGGQEK